MANQMMIDIETLDTRPSAIVFQVGVVFFQDPFTDQGWQILEKQIFHLDILDQIMAGRTMDPETQKWWMTQDRDAWDRQGMMTVSFSAMIGRIAERVSHWGVGDVWSNSPSFDAVIMRSANESLKCGEFPFNFRMDMDLRTVKQIISRMGRLQKYADTTPSGLVSSPTHNALRDAEDQTYLLGFLMKEMRELNETRDRYEEGEITEYKAPDPDPLPR